MVEHESVDPKAQGKPGLEKGVMLERVCSPLGSWGCGDVELDERYIYLRGAGWRSMRVGGESRSVVATPECIVQDAGAQD